MATFYNQPSAHRFGTALVEAIGSPRWHAIEVGVAWVRRSGFRHIRPAIIEFLQRGGVFRISVGIDFDNTSAEGLQELLALREFGQVEPFVCYNEATTVFHPKVYLFQNTRSARLIVGSNNLTESGLFANTEAGLEVELPINDPVIADARAALASWRDTSRRLALQLDDVLMRDLVDGGYIFTEDELNRRRGQTRATTGPRAPRTQTRDPLFARVAITVPRAPGPAAAPRPRAGTTAATRTPVAAAQPQGVGRVLLMRVRKANLETRPTQTQLPMRVVNEPMFRGVRSIISAHDNREHLIVAATARGGQNTLKLEIPEMRNFVDPVLRLEKTDTGISYEAYDADSTLGKPIYAALLRGMEMTPKATLMTTADREHCTWWRFI